MPENFSKISRLIELNTKLDDLIEFAGALEKVFGNTGAYEKVFGKVAAAKGWGTGGVATQVGGNTTASYLSKFNAPAASGSAVSRAASGLDKVAAGRGWGTRGVATPVGGNTTASYLSRFNAPVAATQAGQAQKVAQVAGQNVAAKAAGTNATQTGMSKKFVTGGLGLGAGALIATPDAMLKQREEMSARLDDLIEMASPSIHMNLNELRLSRTSAGWKLKPRTPSPYSQHFHSGDYHDQPKWVNKDIGKSIKKIQGLSARLDDLVELEDPRPRNPMGQFSPEDAGGPDPNSIAAVYKIPQMQPTAPAGIPKLAGAALVGGALGQIGGNAGKEGWAGMTKLVKHLSKKVKK